MSRVIVSAAAGSLGHTLPDLESPARYAALRGLRQEVQGIVYREPRRTPLVYRG